MKNSNQSFMRTICNYLFILGFLFLLSACNDKPSKDKAPKVDTEEIVKVNDIYWNVKAIHPDGQSLDVKAFDPEGNSFDLKVIQNSDQTNFLDVKVIIDGEKLPVKMLESHNQFVPVAAINKAGVKYPIKSVTA